MRHCPRPRTLGPARLRCSTSPVYPRCTLGVPLVYRRCTSRGTPAVHRRYASGTPRGHRTGAELGQDRNGGRTLLCKLCTWGRAWHAPIGVNIIQPSAPKPVSLAPSDGERVGVKAWFRRAQSQTNPSLAQGKDEEEDAKEDEYEHQEAAVSAQGPPSAPHPSCLGRPSAPSPSRSMRISRGSAPLLGPTMPRFSSSSMIRAARP
jgi:hypothetical protein